MSMTLRGLARRIKTLNRKIEIAANKIAIDTSIILVSELIFVTPVDTSKALSNWQVTLKPPNSIDDIDPYFYGIRGSTWSVSTSESVSVGISKAKLKKPKKPLYITNKTPYISDLNSGSSTQRAAGFVEIAVLNATEFANSQKLDIKLR